MQLKIKLKLIPFEVTQNSIMITIISHDPRSRNLISCSFTGEILRKSILNGVNDDTLDYMYSKVPYATLAK